MIYLVSNNLSLFEEDCYERISLAAAVNLVNSWECIQFDVETGGRNPHLVPLLCSQFGNKKEDIQIVVDCQNNSNILAFKEPLENKEVIGHNIKFDLQFLYNYSIVPLKVYDTMIAEQVLYLGYPVYGKPGGISYALKALGERYLGIDIDKSTRGEIIWRGLDSKVILYAAGDVKYLEDIKELQEKEAIKKDCIKAIQLENRFVPVTAYLEWCGIKLDQEKWKDKIQNDLANLETSKKALDSFIENLVSKDSTANNMWTEEDFCFQERVYGGNTRTHSIPEGAQVIPNSGYSSYNENDCTHYDYVKIKRKFPFCEINLQGDLFTGFDPSPHCIINWSSSKQVIQVAKFLGFNTVIQDKKTGETKDSVLEKELSNQRGINDEFLDLYFKYQEYSKLVSSFGQGHLNAVNPKTGRIHTTYKQLGAASGRMSCGSSQSDSDLAKFKKLKDSDCKYPNIQQLPHDEQTRSCFVAESGNLWVSCDYSAMEARLAGDIYNDQAVKDIFLKGIDSHSMYAKIFFKEALKDVDVNDIKKLYPEFRSRSKGPEFALNFGGGVPAIMKALQCTREEAEQIVKNYEEGFKGTAEFAKKASKEVRQLGYVLINPITGHKMYWHDWDYWKKQEDFYHSDKFSWTEYTKNHKGTGDSIEKEVKLHFKAASKWDRLARNAPTQGKLKCSV